jgi:hypothetical protein
MTFPAGQMVNDYKCSCGMDAFSYAKVAPTCVLGMALSTNGPVLSRMSNEYQQGRW